MSRETAVALADLVAATCFILALKGLSSPRSARRGNAIGAAGAVLAVVTVLAAGGLRNGWWIAIAIVVGSVAAVPVARRVQMTAMPQLVALFNGVGGGAAALVALLELPDVGSGLPKVASVVTMLVGSVSFSGSVLTFLKLQELISTRSLVVPGHPIWFGLCAVAAVAVAVLACTEDSTGTGRALTSAGLLALGLAIGLLFVLPVGGADVPIVISLLNAFTGLTVAASGYVLGNVLLLIAGTLVGASGTILTRLMAKAMGRPLTATLFGALRASTTSMAASATDRPVRSATAEDVAILLRYASKVIVVPGYGLAVAQAQHVVRELAGLLAADGVELLYGIHPVAGRMPGHMNVLLAEANVPYEQLKEMEEVNPQFATTDVVLVIGANDVVNPASRTPGTPISGMPILDADQARNVVFLKRSMRPGFAGIDNELLYLPNTSLLFGDAKDSLTSVVSALKSL